MKHFTTWTIKDITSVVQELETSSEGLSSKVAKQRLDQFGPNHIDIKSESAWTLLGRQLRSPFNYLLIISACIELFIGECTNAVLILILTLLNVCIGFFQEYKAHRAIVLLRRFIPSMTTVIRNGKQTDVPKDSLVPGDIVVLKPGSIVPADVRLMQGQVIIDESTLTGEAEPVTKSIEPLVAAAQEIFQATNIVFAGTTVVGGVEARQS